MTPRMDDHSPFHPALLPAGLRDLLPPEAETEAASVATLMDVFASHGYARVEPPLLEFEDSFLGGSGAAVADHSFRIMDPDSHRMMVLRPDMTPQIARIAAIRLAASPRPLRLSYAGQCVRVRGGQSGTGRQVPQAGIELVGADSIEADAEVMLVGAEALAAIGLTDLSLDLTLPTLAPALLDEAGFTGDQRASLARALDRKDAAAVAEHGGHAAGLLTDLLQAAGPAAPALAALARAALPPAVSTLARRLAELVRRLTEAAPQLRLTVDPLEFRGFRYHTGIAFTVFAPGQPGELGRGGRYFSADGEPATGITLLADAVLRAAPPRPPRRVVFLPPATPTATGRALRAEGWVTLGGLAADMDAATEAVRLGCTHVYTGAAPVALRES